MTDLDKTDLDKTQANLVPIVTHIPVKFAGNLCHLVISSYADKPEATALALVDLRSEEPIAKCTMLIKGLDLFQDEVAIKEYGENKGMTDALIAACVIHAVPITTLIMEPVGIFRIYQLTTKVKEYYIKCH